MPAAKRMALFLCGFKGTTLFFSWLCYKEWSHDLKQTANGSLGSPKIKATKETKFRGYMMFWD